MKALWLALIVVAGTTTAASAQVELSLAADIDLSSAFGAGIQPSAVAWNGSTAWVGAYNSSGVTANTFVVPVTSVLSSPSFGTAFGAFSTNTSRGISGIAVRGNTVAVALDNGAGSGDSIRAFDVTTGNLNWRIGDAGAGSDSTRRGNGVAFDPGFNGGDATPDVAYLSIGSGRRHRLDASTGVYTNGQNAGAIINFSPVSTTFRDLDFDPATGDLYTRESNRIGKALRTADNTFSGAASIAIGGLTTATAVDNQNIAFAATTLYGNVLFVNDRTAVGGGQIFSNIVKAFDTSGNALSLAFSGFTPSAVTGNGAYDFSFDSLSQSLAVTDFSNKRLYVFRVTAAPEPGALALLGIGLTALGATVRRRR